MKKIKVDWGSIVSPGLEKNFEDFKVVLICGYQGSGKNFFAFYDINKLDRDVVTNVHSYHHPIHHIDYFTKLTEIYNDYRSNLAFVIDECSKKFPKDCRIDQNFYGWLQQSRKTNRYVYLIFQEYIMVPNWIRGVANRVYITSKIPIFPLFASRFGIPTLNAETKEWEVDTLVLFIYKRTKEIGNQYDTYEIIHEL